jgi:hypothetical protein
MMEHEGKQGDNKEKKKIRNTEELEIVVWRSWYPIWSILVALKICIQDSQDNICLNIAQQIHGSHTDFSIEFSFY